MIDASAWKPNAQSMTDSGAKPPRHRGHETVLNWLAEAVELSITVLGELEAGFRLGQRYAENASTLADFLDEPFVEVTQWQGRSALRATFCCAP